jgi:sortase A
MAVMVRRRAGILQRMLVVIVAAIGLAVILYPAAGTWVIATAIDEDLHAYARQVDQSSPTTKQQYLMDAQSYNLAIPQGRLQDPFASASKKESASAGFQLYREQLAIAGRDAMGRVAIPSIGLELPIYHGTDDFALSRGAGHLYGSSLPVGGPGTHAVITAHAGLPHAAMFTDLSKVVEGDLFTMDVLDQTLTYRVDQVVVVKPDDISQLMVVSGKDYVTLVTCTPINVNSHRLLVRGERVSESAALPPTAIPGPGFPWFIPIFVLGLSVLILLAYGGRTFRPHPPRPNQQRERGSR